MEIRLRGAAVVLLNNLTRATEPRLWQQRPASNRASIFPSRRTCAYVNFNMLHLYSDSTSTGRAPGVILSAKRDISLTTARSGHRAVSSYAAAFFLLCWCPSGTLLHLHAVDSASCQIARTHQLAHQIFPIPSATPATSNASHPSNCPFFSVTDPFECTVGAMQPSLQLAWPLRQS